MSFDPDDSRRDRRGSGAALPPVAPPPRKIVRTEPSSADLAVFQGLSRTPAPPRSFLEPPNGSHGPLPPVSAPARRMPSVAPSRDPHADSITNVKTPGYPDTIPEGPRRHPREDPYGLDATSPRARAEEVSAEPLDWDEEEESTNLIARPRPERDTARSHQAPHESPKKVRSTTLDDRIAAPPFPRAAPLGALGRGSERPAALDAPPPMQTVRIDTIGGPGPAQAPFNGPPGTMPPGTMRGGFQAVQADAGARSLEAPAHAGAAVETEDEEVVRDQPFVRLPHGNPNTNTELQIRKPSLPPHLMPEAPSVGAKRWLLGAGVAALVSVVALVAFVFSRRPGGIEVDVTSAAGGSVPKAEVYVDGRKVCDATPCTVRDMEVGRYSVRVLLPGDAALEPKSAEVSAGAISRVTFSVAPAAATLAIGTDAPGARLFVDGVDRGPLPAKITDLAPGSHDIKLAGDRYKPWLKTVDVKAGDTLDLGAPKLDVVKGRVVVSVKTEGVSIVLVRNGDVTRPKALEGPFPRPIEVETSSGSWKLIAKKKGLPDFTAPLDFTDGIAEKAILVDLEAKADKPPEDKKEEPVAAAPTTTTPGPAAPTGFVNTPPPAPEPPAPKETAAAVEPTGTGTLNINSLPASRILLDGKPMGETPKTGIQVSAGTHTVTFIHPELGKKSVSVKVGPGETKTASAKLRAD